MNGAPQGPANRKAEADALIAFSDKMGSEFLTAQEWGIFRSKTQNVADPLESEIILALEQTRKDAEADKIADAQSAFLRAKSAFARAQGKHWWYQVNNEYGLLPILFTVLAAIVAFDLINAWIEYVPSHQSPAHAAMLGLLGAVLRSLYWLQFQLGKGQLRPRFMVTFVVAPFIGAILGAVSFLMVLVGSKLLTAGDAAKVLKMAPDTLAVGLVAAFAGYNWEWALSRFLVAANTLASKIGIGSAGSEKSEKQK